MRIQTFTALLACGLIVLCSTSTFAKKGKKAKKIGAIAVTGLAAIHTLKRTRGRLCMADHFHFGDGASRKSKARALVAARANWAYFVSAEYGSAWARYSVARSKGGKCSRTKGLYNCSISARPCMR
ncbi:MAG: hypothetical protein GY927_10065 [bacterium]|nr:hypothetical protein [bacterium]